MTSKEALDIAFYSLSDHDNDIYSEDEQEKAYYIIEKDLEVLEIIKKGFSKNFLAERLKDAYLRDDLNDEDYETIENWEWLENDK